MRKWNQIMVAASAVAVMGIFTGCASKNTETTAPVETTAEAVTEAESPTDDIIAEQPESVDERELVDAANPYGNPVVDIPKMVEDLGSLLGEDDEKTVFLLGEGVAVTDENGSVSSRQYNMKLMDLPTVTDIIYNEDKVAGIQLVLEGADAENCKKQLGESFKASGKAEETTNDGSDIDSMTWNVSGYTVELLNAFDTVSLQITGAV